MMSTDKSKKIIYHYTNANSLINIIQSQSFWISKSEYLNDASEQILIKKYLTQYFKKNTHMNKSVQNFISTSLEKYIKEYNYYILSFSESDDSLPLWNYYSNNDGYNIGVEQEELMELMESYFKKEDSEIQVIHTKIDYVDDETADEFLNKIKELLSSFTLFSANDLENHEKLDHLNKVVIKLANLSFSMKHSAYSSEQEERIVIISKKKGNLTLKEEFRVYKGAFIPYIVFNKEREANFNIPIKKVKISPYQTLDVAKDGISYLIEKNGYQIQEQDITKSEIPSRY